MPVAGIVLAAVIVAAGAYVADWNQTGMALVGADMRFVAISIAFLTGTLVLFTFRWRQLVVSERKIPFRELFCFLMIGYLGNAILPARPGDILRAVLLRQKYQVSMSAGIASVVLERIVDLSAVCGLGIVMSLLIPLPPIILSAVYAVSAGVVGFVLVLLVMYRHRDSMRRVFYENPRIVRYQTTRFLAGWLGRFVSAFDVMNSPSRLIASLFLTGLGWALLLAFMMSLIFAFHLPVPPAAALLVLIATNLGALLPLSPGAVGVYHFMTVISLSLWGVDSSTAIAFAIASHAIAIGLHIFLGTICLWHEGLRFRSLGRMSWQNEEGSATGGRDKK